MTRHFVNDLDLAPDELEQILTLAEHMSEHPYQVRALEGPQTAAVIFDKTSTRTRVSFATGIAALGGNPLVINPGEAQLGHKESIADTARVLGRQVSLIIWRTHAHSGLEEMAQYSPVPVINALSEHSHPCQLLADLMTLRQQWGSLAGKTLAYVGDAANNMAHSYALAGVNAGLHVRIAGPQGHIPGPDVVALAQQRAALTGGSLTVTTDLTEAVRGAHAVATDTWVSMGQAHEAAEAQARFGAYQLNAEVLALADPAALVLHCLPAYRGAEITADVLDGPHSVVWDEAENRLHAQKALMAWLLVESGLADESTAALVRKVVG